MKNMDFGVSLYSSPNEDDYAKRKRKTDMWIMIDDSIDVRRTLSVRMDYLFRGNQMPWLRMKKQQSFSKQIWCSIVWKEFEAVSMICLFFIDFREVSSYWIAQWNLFNERRWIFRDVYAISLFRCNLDIIWRFDFCDANYLMIQRENWEWIIFTFCHSRENK